MKRVLLCILSMTLLLSACGNHADPQDEPNAPTWQEQYDLGVRYLSEGNYEEAIIAFTAAIEIDPKQALAYVGRGDAYVQSGETEENLAAAQGDYEMAIGLDKTNVDAYLGLADVYIQKGEYDKALEILQQGFDFTADKSIQQMINDMSPDVSSDVTSDNKMTRFYATVSDIELLDPLEGHNEGSVGQLNFSYAWDTTQIPASLGSRIYTALIAGWNQDGFTDEDILSGASTWEDIWKNGGSLWKDCPYSRNAFPVWEDDLGTTQQVLLYALDQDGNVVGYLILPISVPG